MPKFTQGKCPRCNSENLVYGTSEIVDNQIFYPVECADCGFAGREWYDLTFTGFTDENNEDVL